MIQSNNNFQNSLKIQMNIDDINSNPTIITNLSVSTIPTDQYNSPNHNMKESNKSVSNISISTKDANNRVRLFI